MNDLQASLSRGFALRDMLISLPCALSRSVTSLRAVLGAVIGVMNEPRPNDAAREGIQDRCQEHEMVAQPDVDEFDAG